MNRAAVLAGLGTWLPENVVTNDELARRLDTSDEWIRTRTGIRQRHVIGPGQSTGDLAVEAGRRALKSAGTDQADMVMVATSTPDRPCPATAPDVASRLGLTGVPAFDIAAVCTGFVYALGMASAVIGSGAAGSVLVIGADTFSTILDPEDRTTRAVFGDGGGRRPAAPRRPRGTGRPRRPRPRQRRQPQRTHRGPRGRLAAEGVGPVRGGGRAYFTMRGRAVFSEAVRRMATSVETAAERLGWAPGDIDRVVLHQANARILAAVADRMGLPARRFVSNIGRVGNTVAASIPLALADGVIEGALRPGQRVVLGGFGGGLTWGAMGLRWPDITPV